MLQQGKPEAIVQNSNAFSALRRKKQVQKVIELRSSVKGLFYLLIRMLSFEINLSIFCHKI